MRILCVSMDAAPYSDRSHEVKVAEEMVRQGHEVLLVAERKPLWTVASPKPEGLMWLGAQPVNEPAKAASVAERLLDADVGFASSVSGAPILAAWKKRSGKPVVAQVLDCPLWRLRYKERGPWWASWRPWWLGLLEMDALVVNTEQTRADVVELAGLYGTSEYPQEKVHTVYYGVDTDAADAAKPDPALAEHPNGTVGCVGRLVGYRGVDLAIEALALIPLEKRPQLVVVGAGDDMERLFHLATLAGVGAVFRGGCSDAVKWATIKACTMGVALQFNPNIPQQAGTEFLYAGKPCLVSDLPIHRERTGDFASYVNPFDTRAIAEWIVRIQNARLVEMSGARSWVLEHRSFKSHARGVLETLQRCAA